MEENKNKAQSNEKEPNILPATEVVKNDNPRANENLPATQVPADNKKNTTGSEVTDGEDG